MFTTRPEIVGTFGVAASTHWLASTAAMGVLERGGNAFDAAACGGFVLQIAEPHLNGPGGDCPIIAYDARTDRTAVICGQGPAPRKATVETFESLGLDKVPGTGLLAAVVPGAFDAWLTLLRDHGNWGLPEVLGPAVAYAERGCPMVAHVGETIGAVRNMLRDEWPGSAAIYLPDGEPPGAGALLRNLQLAETYRRLSREAASAGGREAGLEKARQVWREGFVAEAIDAFCRDTEAMDVSGRRHRGLLTGDDLANWSAPIEAPLASDYRGITFLKPGAWSQGPVFLQQLRLLEGFDIADMDPLGPDFVHIAVECAKLAFADREAYYGDPDFVDVPVNLLLSREYAERRRNLISKEASLDLRPGEIEGFDAAIPETEEASGPAGVGAGEPTAAQLNAPHTASSPLRGDTCHIDVIDRWGNMASATPSGGWLQGSPAIPELGFCLGTRAQMFWLMPGLPASLEPGKRPRSTLSPSMALRDGKPFMSFGTPGGDGQDQWQTWMIMRHLNHGMNLQEAIDAPSFHTEHFPNSFWPRARRPGHVAIEGRFPRQTIATLEKRGHRIEAAPDWSEGRISAAQQDGEVLRAAANPRGMQGYAVGR